MDEDAVVLFLIFLKLEKALPNQRSICLVGIFLSSYFNPSEQLPKNKKAANVLVTPAALI